MHQSKNIQAKKSYGYRSDVKNSAEKVYIDSPIKTSWWQEIENNNESIGKTWMVELYGEKVYVGIRAEKKAYSKKNICSATQNINSCWVRCN